MASGTAWKTFIVSSFTADEAAIFSIDTTMKSAGQPYIFTWLQRTLPVYKARLVVHVNGGAMVESQS